MPLVLSLMFLVFNSLATHNYITITNLSYLHSYTIKEKQLVDLPMFVFTYILNPLMNINADPSPLHRNARLNL